MTNLEMLEMGREKGKAQTISRKEVENKVVSGKGGGRLSLGDELLDPFNVQGFQPYPRVQANFPFHHAPLCSLEVKLNLKDPALVLYYQTTALGKGSSCF